MNYNFIEIYDKLIEESKNQYIKSSNFEEKPIMVSGIITPDSTISIQPVYGVEFRADKSGMHEVLKLLQEKLSGRGEEENKKLTTLLADVYTVTEEFLGGHGNSKIRQDAYLNNNCLLTLSDIKEKNIGQCAERATMAQNCLSVLEKIGIIKSYSPQLTNSHLTVDGNRVPHSFVMLINKDSTKDSFLFDIENILQYKPNSETKAIPGVGLFSVSPKELEKFTLGESLKLQSIYEKFGMEVIDEARYYGNSQVRNRDYVIDTQEIGKVTANQKTETKKETDIVETENSENKILEEIED